MRRGPEPRHVVADLGHDHARGRLTDAWDRRQDLDVPAKRAEVLLDARLQLAHGLVQSVDLLQVQLDQEAVVVADVAPERLDQLYPMHEGRLARSA